MTRLRSRICARSSRSTQVAPLSNNHGWLSLKTPSPPLGLRSTPRKRPPPLDRSLVTTQSRVLSATSAEMRAEEVLYQDTLQHMQSFIEDLEPRALQAIYQLAADRLRVWLTTTLPTASNLNADDAAAAHDAARQLALLALSRTYRPPSLSPHAFRGTGAQIPADGSDSNNKQARATRPPSTTEPPSSNPLPLPATPPGPTASRAQVDSQHSLPGRHRLAIRNAGGTPDIALLWNSIPNRNVDRSHAGE
ncbi:hypothetical protein C8Q76DRAFT_797459 [Earliella scabrosa]|nr:hypothetical protein C8Q76DRAFT_797459 [Earliella scabrosa]